jgi:thiamine-monophosphate kinase
MKLIAGEPLSQTKNLLANVGGRMERELIHWLEREFSGCRHAILGIGDDAAVIRRTGDDIVMTSDAICDGVHFLSAVHEPERIGYKALAAAMSDLACMGAEPLAATISLTLPDSATLAWTQRMFVGMKRLVERFGVDICGGDTTIWSGKLIISVSVIGVAPPGGAWRINTARPGDRILVTGEFGGSLLGKHLDFEPRFDFSKRWRDSGLVRACTDVTDSLGLDLAKVARASAAGFVIDSRRIPVSPAAKEMARQSGKDALRHALEDGEDFELLVIASPDAAKQLLVGTATPPGLVDIGEVLGEPGLFIMDEHGVQQQFTPHGFEHRSSAAKSAG